MTFAHEVVMRLLGLCVRLDILLLLLFALYVADEKRQWSALRPSCECVLFGVTYLEEALSTSLPCFPPSLFSRSVRCVLISMCKVFWRGSGICSLKRLACRVECADQCSQGCATTKHHGDRTSSSAKHETSSATTHCAVDRIILLTEVSNG